MVCQCASMSPGMSTRPPPAMTVAPSFGVNWIDDAGAMRSIVRPRTRTSDGPDRPSLFPSKMRTFWNSVTGPVVGGGAASACWASAIDDEPSSSSEDSRARVACRFMSFIWVHFISAEPRACS